MNLTEGRGKIVYGVMNALATLAVLPVALTFLGGFFYAGLAGNDSEDAGYGRYAIFALAGILASVLVVIGFFGSNSRSKIFSLFSIIGTSLLLFMMVPFALKAVRGGLQAWTLAIALIELIALTVSCLKLKQLSFEKKAYSRG